MPLHTLTYSPAATSGLTAGGEIRMAAVVERITPPIIFT